jgi:peptide deformylase
MSFNTDRSYGVIARGKNMYGEDVVIEGSELLARCIQHETDHLDGVLFVDRLDVETRKIAMKSIREAEWFGLDKPIVKFSPHETFGLSI